MARATALDELRGVLSAKSLDALQAGLADPDALVRAAAARALDVLPPPDRLRLGRALLDDSVRLVRATASVALAGTSAEFLSAPDASALDRGIREAVAVELAVAERPEAHLNLSNLYLKMGRTREAEAELRTALRLDPPSVAARVNLADLYRGEGREADAERVLREALAIEPNAAEAYHALGLLQIRLRHYSEALANLGRAHQLRADNARYGYVYAVGLDAVGRTARAVQVLTAIYRVRPGDADTLAALASFEEKEGHRVAAVGWAEKLVAARPDDADTKELLDRLRR
jgi:tetratricopeptide (TPR) repeat protein